jgi:hypothetical protein
MLYAFFCEMRRFYEDDLQNFGWTNFMEQSHWDANNHSGMFITVFTGVSLDLILTLMNPFHILTPYDLKPIVILSRLCQGIQMVSSLQFFRLQFCLHLWRVTLDWYERELNSFVNHFKQSGYCLYHLF